jgi:hypothetical protein
MHSILLIAIAGCTGPKDSTPYIEDSTRQDIVHPKLKFSQWVVLIYRAIFTSKIKINYLNKKDLQW